MNRLVLDASVALKTLLPQEQHHDLALALLMEFRSRLRELIAPDLLPAEMGHALMRAERKGIIDQGVTTDEKLINSLPTFPIVHLTDV